MAEFVSLLSLGKSCQDHTGYSFTEEKQRAQKQNFLIVVILLQNDVNIARMLSQVTHERVLIKSKLNQATTTQTIPDSNGERIFHPRHVLTINDRNKFSFVVLNFEHRT